MKTKLSAVNDSLSQKLGGIGPLLLLRLAASLALFLTGLLATLPEWAEIAVFAASFLLAGGDVIFEAVEELVREHSIDEDLLMTVAGIAAFCIGQYAEGAAVMLLFRVGETLEDIAVSRSKRSVDGLLALRPDTVTLLRQGEEAEVPAAEAAVGDIMVLRPGQRIGLDAVVTEGSSTIDTSPMTGEALPATVGVGDALLSGSVNLSSRLLARVTSSFGESTVSRVLQLVEKIDENRAAPEKFITRFSRVYTPVVIGLTVLLALLPPLLTGADFAVWIHRALVLLVVSCPCALVISVPLTYFAGIGAAAKRGILFKSSSAMDNMANAATVVFDKTGTLTTGSFSVTAVEPVGMSADALLMLAAYAEHFSSHPLAASIKRAYPGVVDEAKILDCHEERGRGIAVRLDKSEIFAGSADFMAMIGVDVEVSDAPEATIYVSVKRKYAGRIVLSDTPKEDAEEAVALLRQAGIGRVVMLTGDKPAAAKRVGAVVGISEIYAGCLPDRKAAQLEKLLKELPSDRRLVYVGDGVNDAPVLSLADVGVSMGAMGSGTAVEASDVVIMNDEPTKVAAAIGFAREAKKIVRQNIAFALAFKLIVAVLGVTGVAPMWLAVAADVGVTIAAVLNAMRQIPRRKK